MEDLIKRLQYLSRVTKDYDQEHMTSADYEMIPTVTKQAADRIEELVQERDEYKAAAAIWQEDFIQENQRLYVATVKLAIAVEALREIVSNQGYMDDPWSHAAATLAELEAK
jgi:hypothetical protein